MDTGISASRTQDRTFSGAVHHLKFQNLGQHQQLQALLVPIQEQQLTVTHTYTHLWTWSTACGLNKEKGEQTKMQRAHPVLQAHRSPSLKIYTATRTNFPYPSMNPYLDWITLPAPSATEYKFQTHYYVSLVITFFHTSPV